MVVAVCQNDLERENRGGELVFRFCREEVSFCLWSSPIFLGCAARGMKLNGLTASYNLSLPSETSNSSAINLIYSFISLGSISISSRGIASQSR